MHIIRLTKRLMMGKCRFCQGEVKNCDGCGNELQDDKFHCVDNTGHFCKFCVHDGYFEDD